MRSSSEPAPTHVSSPALPFVCSLGNTFQGSVLRVQAKLIFAGFLRDTEHLVDHVLLLWCICATKADLHSSDDLAAFFRFDLVFISQALIEF